jgi:membrane protease YdiL (CAAX protease family)
MLIPASVAIALQLFVFRNSAIYHLKESPRWFFYYFLVFAVAYVAISFYAASVTDSATLAIISAVAQLLNLGGLILLVVLRWRSGKEAFDRVGLAGGRPAYWFAFSVGILLLYAVMTGLNFLFGLGQVVDIPALIAQLNSAGAAGAEGMTPSNFLVALGVQMVLVGPFLGLLLAFGEEYGWRGYLQGELTKLGKIWGIFLVGLIWGLWHVPVIVMGHNYPGYPALGSLLMTLYTIALSFIFGYAVIKSGSIWLAAFLHALNNQVLALIIMAIYAPSDPVKSFGIGAYGLVVLALVVGALLLLDRKAWGEPVEVSLADGDAGSSTG